MFPNQPQGQQGQAPYQPPAQPQPYQPPYPPAPQQYPTGYPQPQPAQQSPLDYLNQIAPQQPKRKPLFKGLRGIIIIGLILVVIVSLLAFVLNLSSNGKSSSGEQLLLHLTSAQGIANNGQGRLKSSQLRALNSNARIFFTNTNRDIATPLLAANVSYKAIDKTVTAAEARRTTAVGVRLENARLNGVYDRTYAREMAFELATILSLMRETSNQTSSATLKKFLESAYANLEPTYKSFKEYNESV